ncbi:hypothetical protein C882_1255 [Caenispirillum salinarum AK4]|uniref:Uncharacterized protein n=1 Tax=Caenispirillum salinarum AK4 TaxID=1238182 RepID=K9GP15_9PROT|nr:hypothetical protein [Caenispirillum salinarum]EKV27660.1 hypothetical protein C882_1255 [Caenispirillum salinarum AK4]
MRRAAVVVLATLQVFCAAVMPPRAAAAVPEPTAPSRSAGELVAPDAGLAEAQALMAELGLWDGGGDGRASAAFGQAVRRARGMLGLPPETLAPVDDDLLSALRSRAEARRTARQLEDARAREEAAAHAAVAASPLLTAALRPRTEDDVTEADPEADAALDACRAAPATTCLLEAARRAVLAVTDAELRNWGLSRIARARVARSGRLDDAWPALRLADDPRAVFTTLSAVAEEAAEAGRADLVHQAVAALETYPPVAARAAAEAARILATTQPSAARALTAHAETLLGAVPGQDDRRAVLSALALAAQAQGEADRARALLDAAPGPPEALAAARASVGGAAAVAPLLRALPPGTDTAARRAVLVELAAAHAADGDAEAAVAATQAIDEARYRAVALAGAAAVLHRPDLLERAETTAQDISLPFARAFALAHVAEAWLALDRPAQALAAARRVETDTLAVAALDRIARRSAAGVAVRAEAARAAQTRLTAMIDRVARVRVWADRARALAGPDPAAAGAAARAAVDGAMVIRNRWSAARALLHAAEAVAALDAAGGDVAPADADVEGDGGR